MKLSLMLEADRINVQALNMERIVVDVVVCFHFGKIVDDDVRKRRISAVVVIRTVLTRN